MRHLIHIDTASSNIGGHQNRRILAAEVFQSPLATILTFIGMNRRSRQARLRQLTHDAIRPVLRPTEDNRALRHKSIQELHQQCGLLLLRHNADTLLHQFSGFLTRFNRDIDGVPQNCFRQLPNLRTHRRRKQQRLTLFWNPLQDAANRRQETHIQHPVCFVKNQHLQTVHIGTALLHQIKQAAGSCHDNIGTVSQRPNLWLHPHTTINHSRSHCSERAVITEAFMNLQCQFASTCQNQHSHWPRHSRTIASTAFRPSRRFRTAVQLVQQR
jgi:hypothetical protein